MQESAARMPLSRTTVAHTLLQISNTAFARFCCFLRQLVKKLVYCAMPSSLNFDCLHKIEKTKLPLPQDYSEADPTSQTSSTLLKDLLCAMKIT